MSCSNKARITVRKTEQKKYFCKCQHKRLRQQTWSAQTCCMQQECDACRSNIAHWHSYKCSSSSDADCAANCGSGDSVGHNSINNEMSQRRLSGNRCLPGPKRERAREREVEREGERAGERDRECRGRQAHLKLGLSRVRTATAAPKLLVLCCTRCCLVVVAVVVALFLFWGQAINRGKIVVAFSW